MCTTRTWNQDIDELGRKRPKKAVQVENGFEDAILRAYRRGMSCVDISITNNIPFSKVYDVVRRNTSSAMDIKV